MPTRSPGTRRGLADPAASVIISRRCSNLVVFMPLLRRLIRIPLLAVHVVLGVIVIILAVLLDRVMHRELHQGLARLAQVFWCRSICLLLGIRVRVAGPALASPPLLVVANHVSWLDILVIAANWRVSFLSKSEVRRWPGIGIVASALGTLYIERGRNNASADVAAIMRQRLEQGHRVLFFPEGTTSDGSGLLPFRPRLFQAAVDAGAPVQALALRYLDSDGGVSATVPFVRNDNLVRHVMGLAGSSRTEAVLTPCEPLQVAGKSRSDLARRTHAQIAGALGLPARSRAAVRPAARAAVGEPD